MFQQRPSFAQIGCVLIKNEGVSSGQSDGNYCNCRSIEDDLVRSWFVQKLLIMKNTDNQIYSGRILTLMFQMIRAMVKTRYIGLYCNYRMLFSQVAIRYSYSQMCASRAIRLSNGSVDK